MNFSKEQFYMVRTYSAGVFAGYIKEINDSCTVAILTDARRIWYWDGAATLSELATLGTSKPQECKFPCAVSEVALSGVIEIIPITDEAKRSLENVSIWSEHE